jgi:hypothetical protein
VISVRAGSGCRREPHLAASPALAADGRGDHEARRSRTGKDEFALFDGGEFAVNLGEVDLFAARGGQGLAQAVPRFAAARGQQYARRAHVQAVAKAALARVGRGGRALGKTRHQRACGRGAIARPQGMTSDARGLVDGHEIAVLVEHRKFLSRGWLEHDAGLGVLGEFDGVAGLQMHALLGGAAIDLDDASSDCPSCGRRAGNGLALGQETVEP